MPHRCVIYIPQNTCIAIGVPVRQRQTLALEGLLYIHAWGFCVARFDRQGNSYEPQGVERATVQGFTLFLCLYTTLSCITAVSVVPDRTYPHDYR